MELTIHVDEKDLGRIVRTAEPIQCPGASQKSDPTPAFVDVVRAPRDDFHDTGESYVLCPRLKKFFRSGSGTVMRCYEGNLEIHDEHNETQLRDSRKCPYLNPAKKK